MSEPTSIVGVEEKEECNKSAGSTDSGRSCKQKGRQI